MKQKPNTEIKRSLLILAFVFAVIIIISGSYIYYRHEVDRIRHDKYEDISSIANLKCEQIEHWRHDRFEDVERDAKSPLFRKAVEQWLREPQNGALESQLKEFLGTETLIRGYANALMLDPKGNVLLSAQPGPNELNGVAKRAVDKALATRSAVLSELYRAPDGHAHLDAVAPVLNSSGVPIVVIDLVTNSSTTLCEFLQSWPVPSDSAETLLVRKDGSDVLFLNKLRFDRNAALSLRIPLTDTSVPAVQVVLGKTGIFQGLDYRGVEVLADLRPVPNSPWFIVTKVDAGEILAEARYRGQITAIFVVLFILVAAGMTAYFYRVHQTRLYRELYRSEREKLETQEEFRTTLYSIGDGVITTDSNGSVKLMNVVAEQLTGVTESEATGKPLEQIFRIINEESRESVENPVQRVLKEGIVVGLANHTILISNDGKERPIADSGAPIRTPTGEVIGVVLVFRDQTEERTTQNRLERKRQELQESLKHAAFLAELIEMSSQPLGVSYLDQRLGFVNQAFCDLVGYTKEELANVDWERLTPAEWATKEKERLRELRSDSKPVRYEKEYIRKDGSCVPIELFVHLGRDENGAPEYYYAFITDITDRKNAEVALRIEQDKLRNILDNMNDAVRIVNSGHEIEYINRSMEEDFGPVSGRKCYEYFRDSLKPCENCGNHVVFIERPTHCEWLSKKTNKTYEIFDTPIRNADGSISRLAIFHDITHRKVIEEEKEKLQAQLLQSQKMEAVGTLAGGIAHDFNNLLQVILGYSELMMGLKQADEPEYGDLERIHQSAKSGADLVRRLMVFSRKIEPQLVPLDLNNIVKQTQEILNHTIPKMIDIRLELCDDIDQINADPTQVEQILMNLAVNARDAMPDRGNLTIATKTTILDDEFCRSHAEIRPGKYVSMSVADTGQGMDRETVKRIFEPFFTTKDLGRGTGLGLAVVYGIVQQHGGYIWCYSEPGKGTVFKIYFPVLEAGQKQVEEVAELTPPGGKETVLLVDDEESVRTLAHRTLSVAGYTVMVASDGAEALDVYNKSGKDIDLVILDLMMPKMGGAQCLNELLKVDPAAKVIIASGHSGEGGRDEYIRFGAKDFVEKPYESRILLNIVRFVLDSD